MQVIITEKPSVAQDIAAVIGANERKGGYIEGNGYCVTWAYGHLLTMEPDEDSGWNLDKLPIIPKTFKLVPKIDSKNITPEGEVKEDGIQKRLNTIKYLLNRSDGVIIATDAAREGELIGREILDYFHYSKPAHRLWISSLTEESIEQGFREMRPLSDYDNLADSARQRAIADWLVGINATRTYTTIVGESVHARKNRVFSFGRVQTPVLGLICQRALEIKNFVSTPFWFLEGRSVKDGIEFRWRTTDRYTDKAKAEEDRQRISYEKYITVKEVDTKRVQEKAPLLHNIASIQKLANRRFAYTAEETLQQVQSLYEKKLCSYPRTDSRYISEDIFETVPSLLDRISVMPQYSKAAFALLANKDKLQKRSVNNDKVTDHYGLIITKNIPKEGDLNEMEANIYNLIATRFLEAFSPDSVADVTGVLFDAAGVEFSVRGRKDVFLGWRAICRSMGDEINIDDVDLIEMDMQPLPVMFKGEKIPIVAFNLVEDKTKPKPYYTEATLLTAMENAGRDGDEKPESGNPGLGTAATRAETIETIISRGYVERKNKKSLVPTETGIQVWLSVKDMSFASPHMTNKWEIMLEDIAQGKASPQMFESGIKKYSAKIVSDIKESAKTGLFNNVFKLEQSNIVYCPRCKKNGKESHILIREKSAWCPECKLSIYRVFMNKTFTEEQFRRLLTKGSTGVVKGLVGKSGKPFEASFELTEDYKTTIVFNSSFTSNKR